MMNEANVVARHIVEWVTAKIRRGVGSSDADAGLRDIHRLVVAKLGDHPALRDAEEEAGTGDGTVSELTRQQIELAITAAARKDGAFAAAVISALAAGRATSGPVIAGAGSRVFTGDARAEARSAGIAIGQVGGDVALTPPDPPEPGRSLP
ncbi:chromosome partitioning protein [Paractinoplanes ferrugineus]